MLRERGSLSEVVPARAARRLKDFAKSVHRSLPGRIDQVVLFGSRARGDAAGDSDYDLAVFVRNLDDRRAIDHQLADIAYPHVLAGVHIRAVAVPDDYLRRDYPGRLALTIARDGVGLG